MVELKVDNNPWFSAFLRNHGINVTHTVLRYVKDNNVCDVQLEINIVAGKLEPSIIDVRTITTTSTVKDSESIAKLVESLHESVFVHKFMEEPKKENLC